MAQEGPRKQRLILALEKAFEESLHQVGGVRSARYGTPTGRTALIKYACGHERTSTTPFLSVFRSTLARTPSSPSPSVAPTTTCSSRPGRSLIVVATSPRTGRPGSRTCSGMPGVTSSFGSRRFGWISALTPSPTRPTRFGGTADRRHVNGDGNDAGRTAYGRALRPDGPVAASLQSDQ